MAETNQQPDLGDPQVNANSLISWLEEQPESELVARSQDLYDQLLFGASQPRHSSVLACTKLCGFVQHCTKSRHAVVQAWAFSEPTAMKLFDFYIEWNEKDQHRSMKLVLDLLTVLTGQNPDQETAASIRRHMLISLVSIITRQSTRPLVKSCINSLNHLFVRSVYKLEDIANTYREVEPAVASLSDLELWRRFCSALVSWMYLHYVCSVAGKFIVTVFRALRDLAQAGPESGSLHELTVETWLDWLHEELRANPAILENIKLYIFVPLFKTDRPRSLELLDILNRPPTEKASRSDHNELDMDAILRLAALEVGKKSGLVEDPGSSSLQKSSKYIVLDVKVMESVLSHPSPRIRLLALSLLATSPSSTKPYPAEALSLLKTHLPAYHSDPGAGFRQEALVYTKTMIQRIKGTITAGQKVVAGTASGGEKAGAKNAAAKVAVSQEVIQEHENFSKWYMSFLLGELVPTASYQRHITALRAIVQVLNFGKELCGQSIFLDYSWIRSILDLVVDPFSDVRETAISLLMMAPREDVESLVQTRPDSSMKLVDLVRDFRAQAAAMASRTGRADHGDGSARLQGLLCSWASSLEQQLDILNQTIADIDMKLAVAKRDIALAVVEHPVHGDFASISCAWEVLSKAKYSAEDLERLVPIQRRVVECSKEIWNVVKPILCDDSPEGHLPQEMEEAQGLDTKGLLSYSFRAIHESSNTMRLIIAPLRFSRVKGTLCPPGDIFKQIGNLTFEQLSSLRHRGAFSTVSLTFITCCQLVEDPSVTSPDAPAEETLLFSWYKGTLDCIFAQVSTTRRSAGIPALMTGILAANASRPSFDEVISELGEIAQRPARVAETDGSNLPQVHALNCIKDVFKSSLLSVRAEKYLPTFLQVATNSLRSELWAIRNCGLLLLRSVIDSLLGNADSKALLEAGWDGRTIRISYVKYSTLAGILVSLLQSGQEAQDTESQRRAAESVFPALDIIRRAGPPDSHRAQLYSLVSDYLASHLWHVREIAARTLSSFLVSMDHMKEIISLLERAKTSANRLHGTLLTIKFLVEKENLGSDVIASLSSGIESIADLELYQRCPQVQTVHLDLFCLLLRRSESHIDSQSGNSVSPLANANHPALVLNPAQSTPDASLLRIQCGLEAVQRATQVGNPDQLRDAVLEMCTVDTNAAARMIEAVPDLWKATNHVKVTSQLCHAYIYIAMKNSDQEVRVALLNNIAATLESLVSAHELDLLPASQDLSALWSTIQSCQMNPAIFQACLRASGPMMAALCLHAGQDGASQKLGHQLRCWSTIISKAGHDDNAFDTRESAALAIKSFTAAVGSWCATRQAETYLPLLLALYDTLNDDDEEVRDIGAAAAAHVLGKLLVPTEAAPQLLERVVAIMPTSKEFKNYVAHRLTGNSKIYPSMDEANTSKAFSSTTSPHDELRGALTFDESLFVIEEQNLFIDEVRETQRWIRALEALDVEAAGNDATITNLKTWAVEGIEAMMSQAAQDSDGPLGWTSQPKVFAICCRYLLVAEAITRLSGDEQVRSLLAECLAACRKAGVHGTLLDMATTAV
ncbi:hypothetical protein MCOR02_001806 [Pyricularia oryzae]|uniref:Uncharacterized protein n=1 Tax=Pyricularia oryzae TaxID=318829 RepID=A0A4P7N0U6_PYROR|nr:hypothetical protein MCOR02_001806 [Pyricularia oryzae]KAI6471620.1 hypothetical protein MCOR17_003132 [Pyricularia oryzae]KAI6510710.1 hypothetical protein MCOR13_000889 [Pyricularia oryzae]QBZ55763.1 hypothetical protein PoMZ_00665 [Pyricularia oryzae]